MAAAPDASARDPDHGVIYVSFDDNQAIYRRPGGLPEGLVSAGSRRTGGTPRRSPTR